MAKNDQKWLKKRGKSTKLQNIIFGPKHAILRPVALVFEQLGHRRDQKMVDESTNFISIRDDRWPRFSGNLVAETATFGGPKNGQKTVKIDEFYFDRG